MTSPASGWYPDPSGQPGERWWNGVSWGQETRPAAPPAPTPAGGTPTAWDGFGNPVAPAGPDPTPPAYGGPTPAYGQAPYAGGPAGHGSVPPGDGQRSFLARNGYSFATVGVAVGYFLVLVYAHTALVGILPLFLGIGAVRRREPLGWVAAVIGVVALVVGIFEYTR